MSDGILSIPGYQPQGELGKGGMATVYLAVQTALERKVALKVMEAKLAAEDPSFQERFLREGRTVARLTHPNIVTLYDVGYVQGLYFIAMEYLPGGSLKDRILPGGMGVQAALAITRALASALQYAHRQGVIHRDLKPLNVLFRQDRNTPVLTDFGVARINDGEALTKIGVAVGTPAYMSPEQALAKSEIDGRADLYSLGIMLYELLLGVRPFIHDDPYEMARMQVQQAPPDLPPRLGSLQPILDKLLAKDPNLRFADAQALLQALDAIGQAQTFSAQPLMDAPTEIISSTATVPVPLADQAAIVAEAHITTRKHLRLPLLVGGVLLGGGALAVGFLWLAPELFILKPPSVIPQTSDPGVTSPVVMPTHAEALQAQAQVQLAEGKWVEPPGDNAEESYRALHKLDKAAAEQGLRALADILYGQAQMAHGRADTAQAQRWLALAQARFPSDTRWAGLAQQWQAALPKTGPDLAKLSIAELLVLAQRQFDAAQVTDPPGDNAVETYRHVLRRQADQARAVNALRQIADGFEALARSRQARGEWQKMAAAVERGLLVLPEHPGLLALQSQVRR